MSSFCGFIVIISLIIALPLSIILLIIFRIKHKRIKTPIICLGSSISSIIIFTIIGTTAYVQSGEYEKNFALNQGSNSVASAEPIVEVPIDNISNYEEGANKESIVPKTSAPPTVESNNIKKQSMRSTSEPSKQNESEITTTDLTEEEFRNMCIEVKYNDIDKEWIGKYVTKEILFTSSEQTEYQCASTEDYIEDYLEYQHSYRIYDIFDCRLDKSFPIYPNDVIRIYGIITDVKMNYANGLYYPIIDMFYADYIRKWREPIDDTKSIEEIKQERIAENEKIKAENEYFNSLNSDYTGITKNVENMETLSENEFKEKCDSMNFMDMVDSTEDLTGRYVKLHIKITDHKIFTKESGKRRHLGDLVDVYNIDDNVWYAKLFYERTEEYIGNIIWVYFVDNEIYDINSLKEDQELTVYGMILDYEVNKGFHNEFDFLTVYIE